ncbi:MAG: mechanosensitive ion channel family protein [Okeania sp. SIO2F4]|uniref:mechanosensitive ion channel family protein n=1 Tax=Okeania sp. SIO2F4 TaxID=2607790 RepID=UPI00142CA2E7|nr:mechanosensitive ion channel family protein [Okeania sp. SIO2F4]NES06631.1 mechanosensitive ion channel family protein [Okeania sp. SIO2F4]
MNEIINIIINGLKDVLESTVKIIPAILIALIIIFLTRYAAKLLRNLAQQVGKRATRSKSLQILLAKTTHVGTWVIGVIIACVIAFPGLKLGDIIATLGLGSVAVGFAFQDIFKNFLAGILLLLQEPFRIGDQIIVDKYEGTVEQIDIRTTKIRTYNGERVILPNANVFTSAVQVRTAFGIRRTDLGVGVDYNTPLSQAAEILYKLIQKVEGVLEDPDPEIDLVSFNDSSIDFIVRYWTKAEQKEVRRTQTQAIIAIKKVFDRVDINIPYPIRTVYFYNQDKYNDYLPTDIPTDNEKNTKPSL